MKKFVFLGIWLLMVSAVLYQMVAPKYESVESSPSGPLASTVNNPYSHLDGYDTLVRLQDAFVRNARKIKPTVVSINSLQEIPYKSSGRGLFRGEPGAWFSNFRYWLKRTLRKRYQLESLGSGVLYDSQGHILTNYHVVEETEKLLVKFLNRREYSAKIIGMDPKTDLAVLKVFSLSRFPTPVYGETGRVRVGDWVMAIGNPYGLTGTVTVGVISGKGRTDLGIATFENFLQTDASINPGNSGGPLIDLEGNIIGINTAIADIGSGVGFAIPVETVTQIADALIENGEVERGWLGIGIQSLTPEMAESFHVSQARGGVVVNSVDKGAPAERAGLKQGDIIIAYNDKRVTLPKHLQQFVAETKVGDEVRIQILREGQEKTLKVRVGKYM